VAVLVGTLVDPHDLGRDARVSSTGEYAVSNDAGFDPNVGSTKTWRRMQVPPLGR